VPACSAVKGEFCRIASALMSIHNLHFKWKLSKLLKLLGILIDKLHCGFVLNTKASGNDAGINAGFAVNNGKGQI